MDELIDAEEDLAESDSSILQATLSLFDAVQNAGLNFGVLMEMISCDPKARRCSLSAPEAPDTLITPIEIDPAVLRNVCERASGEPVIFFRYGDSQSDTEYIVGQAGERLAVPPGEPIPEATCRRALGLNR